MGLSAVAGFPPQTFHKAMIFIDGTNLFYRFQAEKLKVIQPLSNPHLWGSALSNRQLIRTYLYTSEPHLDKAKKIHGEHIFNGVRIILGDYIDKKDGNYKEKGVDALLVADLIYHAAAKNFDYAVLVSVDTDFAYTIKRAEDFGCQTAVVGVCAPVPKRLQESTDHFFELNKQLLIDRNFVENLP
jgi:uncharacterized LabA/DUF88 family protein